MSSMFWAHKIGPSKMFQTTLERALLIHVISKSMEQSPSVANRHSASQEIFRLL